MTSHSNVAGLNREHYITAGCSNQGMCKRWISVPTKRAFCKHPVHSLLMTQVSTNIFPSLQLSEESSIQNSTNISYILKLGQIGIPLSSIKVRSLYRSSTPKQVLVRGIARLRDLALYSLFCQCISHYTVGGVWHRKTFYLSNSVRPWYQQTTYCIGKSVLISAYGVPQQLLYRVIPKKTISDHQVEHDPERHTHYSG